MNTKQKTKWWVDALLFAGLIVSFFLDFTGVGLHQWIGVFIGALAIYHLLTHWGWVSSVTQRFFGAASGKARLFYLVDAAVLSGLALIAGTGLVISTWLDLSLSNYEAWLAVHISFSIATLMATVLKLGLHWRWIASTTRKIVAQPAVTRSGQTPPERGAGAGAMSRQEFFKVMGVVSIASFLALTNASGSLSSLQQADTSALTQSGTNSVSTRSQLAAGTSSSGSSACTVRCGKGCSYPGHCRRYSDANNNNRCDLGECL